MTAVTRPSPLGTANELRSLTISRSRFVLRLISTIFGMVIVGMMSDAYAAFWKTKGTG